MIVRTILALIALSLAMPVQADRRGFSVTGFTRIQVQGPFVVRVTTGRGSSAYAEGDHRAINEISVQVIGQTLRVRRDVSNNWGGYPGERNAAPAILYLTTHDIEQASVIGTGDLEIDRMDGGRLMATLGGNGRLAIGTVEADHLALTVTGAGNMEVSGHAETGRVTVQGSGIVSAPELMIENITINLNGPGSIEVSADRTADVTAVGNGLVTVLGNAACTDRSVESAHVSCSGFLERR